MSFLGGDKAPACWFAGREEAGPCDGVLIRAHLVPKQRIRRELDSRRARLRREGVERLGGLLVIPESMEDGVVWDRRAWVPMCGGIMGNAGHHGAFDHRQLRIARGDLPAVVEEFAAEFGLEWSLERDYGPKG